MKIRKSGRSSVFIFLSMLVVFLFCIINPACEKRDGTPDEARESKKKLKMKFREDLKERWRRMEAEEKAKRQKDLMEVRKLHPVLPETPDPVKGLYTLEMALKGLEGDGRLTAVIDTDLGSLFCTLFEEEEPLLVANFVGLARGTRPWWDNVSRQWVQKPLYDGTSVFAVYPDSVVRMGCPLGTGKSGPGYVLSEGINAGLKHDRPGRLTMVHESAMRPGVGSQFNILAVPNEQLDGKDYVIGQCEPLSIVQELVSVHVNPKDQSPVEPLKIISVEIKRVAE